MDLEFGIDVSVHNGTIDFSQVKKEGNSFVIIRAGYGYSITQKDPMFEQNYYAAKAANLNVGAYWYSYALNQEQALLEAKVFQEAIQGKQFEYPLYIDMEDADGYKQRNGGVANTTLVQICEVFCNAMRNAGYYPGIYAAESWFQHQLFHLSSQNDKWVASWGTNDGRLQVQKLEYPMHQFTSEYILFNRRFDRNVVYHVNYPEIIKQLGMNHYPKTNTNIFVEPAKPAMDQTHIMQLATDVLKGLYGEGEQRKQQLKDNYTAVQEEVNHRLLASIDELAQEVIQGRYGNQDTRRAALGQRYEEVQARVNQLLNANQGSVYIVQSGDTLSEIANKFQTTIPNLLAMNPNITDANMIYVNQVIKIS